MKRTLIILSLIGILLISGCIGQNYINNSSNDNSKEINNTWSYQGNVIKNVQVKDDKVYFLDCGETQCTINNLNTSNGNIINQHNISREYTSNELNSFGDHISLNDIYYYTLSDEGFYILKVTDSKNQLIKLDKNYNIVWITDTSIQPIFSYNRLVDSIYFDGKSLIGFYINEDGKYIYSYNQNGNISWKHKVENNSVISITTGNNLTAIIEDYGCLGTGIDCYNGRIFHVFDQDGKDILNYSSEFGAFLGYVFFVDNKFVFVDNIGDREKSYSYNTKTGEFRPMEAYFRMSDGSKEIQIIPDDQRSDNIIQLIDKSTNKEWTTNIKDILNLTTEAKIAVEDVNIRNSKIILLACVYKYKGGATTHSGNEYIDECKILIIDENTGKNVLSSEKIILSYTFHPSLVLSVNNEIIVNYVDRLVMLDLKLISKYVN